MARTMLLSSKHIPNYASLWAEAVNTACYLRNRVSSTASKDQTKTPYEVLLNKKPNLQHLRIFGSKAVMHIYKRLKEVVNFQKEEYLDI